MVSSAFFARFFVVWYTCSEAISIIDDHQKSIYMLYHVHRLITYQEHFLPPMFAVYLIYTLYGHKREKKTDIQNKFIECL